MMGGYDPRTVNRLVRERYDGNWLPIIDLLLDEQEKIESTQAEGGIYAVPRTARKLSSKELETYLSQVRLSVLILQCLARKDRIAARPEVPVPFIPMTSFRTRYETYRTQIDTGVRRGPIVVAPPPIAPEKKRKG
jgi:hypothetical protein